MMQYSSTSRASLFLALVMTMDPILGSHMDERDEPVPTTPVMAHPWDTEEVHPSALVFLDLFAQKKFNDAKDLYERTPALQNLSDPHLPLIVAHLYIKHSKRVIDSFDKTSSLERARGIVDKFLSHNPANLDYLRLAVKISDMQYDQDAMFTYTRRIFDIAGKNATPIDLKRKFEMHYILGENKDACITWLELVKGPDQHRFSPIMCLTGARVSSALGAHELVVKSCALLAEKVKSGPIFEEALVHWGNALVKSNRFKDAGDLLMMCSQSLQHERIINLVVIGNLYAKGKAYPEFFNTLPLIIQHNDARLEHFLHVRKSLEATMNRMPARLKREYGPKKLSLDSHIKEKCPLAFTSKPPKTPKQHHDFSDFASSLSAKLIGDCQIEAKEIMNRAAQYKNPALLTQKKPLFDLYKEILNPRSAEISLSSTPSSSSSTAISTEVQALPLTIIQRALERMRVAYGRLVHAHNMMTFDARKALQREATRSASSSAFEEMSPQELPNLRGEILRTHGLPLSAPKPSDSNVDWDSPAASSVPVVEEPPFVHTRLSVESLLSSKAYATFLNIMVAKHHSVTNQDIKTLIEALHATSLFEKASYDKKAGHGSHAKVKLWRKGTPVPQRPKPVTLPKHEAAKDYSMDHLKALFEANGLTL